MRSDSLKGLFPDLAGRALYQEEKKEREGQKKIIYTRYLIFFNFTIVFVLVIEIIESFQNFSLKFGKSTQNGL